MEPSTSDQPRGETRPATGAILLAAVAEALAKNGAPPGYRVVYRTNPKGEHVVAIIWPPESP
jgi:hypothetical protein